MVQTVYYYLDSNSETRNYSNSMKLHHAEKLVSQKNISSNVCVESTKLKSKKKNCIKLQPLNAKIENNVLNTNERKLSHRLNPLSNKTPATDQKKLCSKIPVLQRKIVLNTKQKNDNLQCDTALSAADRRQKFHQSRLRAAGVSATDTSIMKKHQTPLHYDILPYYEGYIVHKIIAPPLPAVNLKNILPPIKPPDMTTGTVQKTSQQKSKCLLGEITHFPALCNPACSKRKKNYTSTVPHLPPILPPPAAPPPSISTSLEKEGNQVKEQMTNSKKNEDWNISKVTFQKLTAV